MEKFAERLKELRLEKELTQKKFSELVGITNSVIFYYENNQVEPTLPNLIKIAKFFDCSIDYLAGLEDFY